MSSRPSRPVLLAPGALSSSVGVYAPGRHDRRPELPAVDERLVAPEAHAEIVGGVVYQMMGANPPHATQHLQIARIFGDCLAPGYEAAVDMLTRATKKTDAAPDVSVFPEGPDVVTGGRKLEEIAFEVLDTETLDHVTRKTRRLARRGVRRIFALRVTDHAVFEWQHARREWEELAAESEIRDRCFVVPIPVRAFVRRVLAHETVARALLATGNPVIIAAVNAAREQGLRDGRTEGLRDGRTEGLRDGHAEGLRDGELKRARASVLLVLTARGMVPTDAQRERTESCTDLDTLTTWLERAVVAASPDGVFE